MTSWIMVGNVLEDRAKRREIKDFFNPSLRKASRTFQTYSHGIYLFTSEILEVIADVFQKY